MGISLENYINKNGVPAPGTEVYLCRFGSWDVQKSLVKIKSCTPKGTKLVLQYGTGLDVEFRPGKKFSKEFLDFDLEGVRADKKNKEIRREAAKKVNMIACDEPVKDTYSKEFLVRLLDEMEERLKEARAAVDQII